MSKYFLQFTLIADNQEQFRVALFEDGESIMPPGFSYFPFGCKNNLVELVMILVDDENLEIQDLTV